jgi:hypothetical protein
VIEVVDGDSVTRAGDLSDETHSLSNEIPSYD